MIEAAVKCGDCKHFISDLEEFRAEDEAGDPDMGHLGHCNAVDTAKLPYTWRWATREVVGAWTLEYIKCPAFEAVNTEEKNDETQ